MPVWMGQLVWPVRVFIRKYIKDIKKICFALCCAGGDDQKDEKFGYEGVFRQVGKLAGNKLIYSEAFPITMVMPEGKRKDSTEIMKKRFSDKNFGGEIGERFKRFVSKIRGS